MTHIGGRYFILGHRTSGDWLANHGHPDFMVHLKQRVHADLPARATLVTDVKTLGPSSHATATWSWGEVPLDDLVATLSWSGDVSDP